MVKLVTVLLILGIISGQLIKLPVGGLSGATALDLAVIISNLILLSKVRPKPLHFPLWTKTFLVFLIITILSLIFTPLSLTLSQSLSSLAYTTRLTNYLLLSYLFIAYFPALKDKSAFILTLAGTTLALLGLLQLIFIPDLGFLESSGWDPHFFRTVSTFLDPNFLGAFLVLILLILISPLFPLPKKFQLPFFLLLFLALLTTFSRSAYLIFAVSFLLLAILNRSCKQVLLTILLTFILGLGYLTYQQTIANWRHIDRSQSASYRANSWQQGLNIFQRAPILGVGYNTYRYALEQYNLTPKDYLSSRSASGSDSSLLFIGATTGIAGLLTYFLFLGSLMMNAWNSRNQILIAGLGGLLVNSFFINSLFYPPILLWLFLMATTLKLLKSPK